MSIEKVIKRFEEELKAIQNDSQINVLIGNLSDGFVNVSDKELFMGINKINQLVDKKVVASSLKVVNSKEFRLLDDKGKADVVRNIVGLAPKVGYNKNASAAEKILLRYFKEKGFPVSPVVLPFNEERLDNAIRSIITQILTEEKYGRARTIIKDAFPNISTSGSRGVFEGTSDYVKEKFNVNVLVQRMVQHSDACDYCKSFKDKWYLVNDNFYRFHDNCRCHVEVSLG